MSLKNLIKNHAPIQLYGVLKSLYQLSNVPHYWFPYAFMNGRALSPTNITIEATFRCNLSCAMCPQAMDRQSDESRLIKHVKANREMTTEEIESLIADAADLGVRNLTITGGEPLLRKDIIGLLTLSKSKGLNTSLLTNGTIISDKIAEGLVRSGVDKISFSLDGPEDIHDSIRKTRNSFLKLKKTIQQIQKEKKSRGSKTPTLSLTCTISAMNADRLSETIDVARELQVGMHYGYLFYSTEEMEELTNKIITMGESKDEEQDIDDSLKNVNIASLHREIKKIIEKSRKNSTPLSFQPALTTEEEIGRRFSDDTYSYCSKCFYPWYAVRVNPYGEVYPCSMGIPMGNIREKKLADIWNGERYIQFRRKLKEHRLFPKCVKCCVLNNKLWSYLPRI